MKTEDAIVILNKLDSVYPQAQCGLEHASVYELLISTMLSAQCTDARVNVVTSKLYKKYNTPEAMLTLSQDELEKLIFSCGFYHTKAKNILLASRQLVELYNGQVPGNKAALCSLPGVGVKTANVVAAVGFGIPSMPVDTHVFRISRRLGFADAKTPEETEKQLVKLIPEDMLIKAHHLLITHGRECCIARKPHCSVCPVKNECQEAVNVR